MVRSIIVIVRFLFLFEFRESMYNIHFIRVIVEDRLTRRFLRYFNPYGYSYFNIKEFLSEEIPFSCNISSHVGIKKILSYIYNPLEISN